MGKTGGRNASRPMADTITSRHRRMEKPAPANAFPPRSADFVPERWSLRGHGSSPSVTRGCFLGIRPWPRSSPSGRRRAWAATWSCPPADRRAGCTLAARPRRRRSLTFDGTVAAESAPHTTRANGVERPAKCTDRRLLVYSMRAASAGSGHVLRTTCRLHPWSVVGACGGATVGVGSGHRIDRVPEPEGFRGRPVRARPTAAAAHALDRT